MSRNVGRAGREQRGQARRGAEGGAGAQGHAAGGGGHIERLQFQAVAHRVGLHPGGVGLPIQRGGQAGGDGGHGGVGRDGVGGGEAVEGGGEDIARRGQEVGERLEVSAVEEQVHPGQRQVGGRGREGEAQRGLAAEHGAVDQRAPVGRAGACKRSSAQSAPGTLPIVPEA